MMVDVSDSLLYAGATIFAESVADMCIDNARSPSPKVQQTAQAMVARPRRKSRIASEIPTVRSTRQQQRSQTDELLRSCCIVAIASSGKLIVESEVEGAPDAISNHI